VIARWFNQTVKLGKHFPQLKSTKSVRQIPL
jgi:hypothetical protein